MADLTIDPEKAERIIAQVLRDDHRMAPGAAIEAAAAVRRRLVGSVPAPSVQYLKGFRMIGSHPTSDFEEAVSQKIADVNYRVAAELWEMVYERGKDLPLAIADPRGY